MTPARRTVAAAAIGLAFISVCCQSQAPPRDEDALQGVVLVVFDTLRADRLSCYGHERPTSPSIDGLATDGVRFEQVVSPSPWTLPSVTSMLAGKYSERVWQEGALTESIVERLSEAGIQTAGFTEGGFFSRRFGHDRGFDHYLEEEGAVQLSGSDPQRDTPLGGGIESTFAAAQTWLNSAGERRFFLLIHTYEPHIPYVRNTFADQSDGGRLGDTFDLVDIEKVQQGELILDADETEYVGLLYDSGVLFADAFLGGVRDQLEQLGLAQDTAVIVTSDHGEELGEHYPRSIADHGHSLRDPLLMVPLVIYDPRQDYPVKVVSDQMRLIDVMPTVADLLEVPVDVNSDGRSLLPVMSGTESGERTAFSSQTKTGPPRVAMRWRGYKFIRTVGEDQRERKLEPAPPPVQLYDLRNDPGELVNLFETQLEKVKLLDDELRRRRPSVDRQISPEDATGMDDELLERLRSLGYLR